MKPWAQKSLQLLLESLEPPCSEPNELDWKVDLSTDTKRLAEHIMGFANHPGGGTFVFGIDRLAQPKSLTIAEVDHIVNKIANLGRDAVEPAVRIDHHAMNFRGSDIVLVHVLESEFKPVHRRGQTMEDTSIRSGGTTRKADRHDIGNMMIHSRTPRWENCHASLLMSNDEVLLALDIDPLFKMMEKDSPTNDEERLRWMQESAFIDRQPAGGAYVTNLGAISAATDLGQFPALSERSARVIVYDGKNRIKARSDVKGRRGYALSFQNLHSYVMSLLPTSEIIAQALRETVALYPALALREIVANALIHQDFTITGSRPTIEIFSDRIEIINPGKLLASKTIERIIGTMPESRNERLATSFFLYHICEQRGSGLMRAGIEIEIFGLPPIKFEEDAHHFKVTLFAPQTFAQMSSLDRLAACYQHALLKYCSNSRMTNKSLRERFKMPEKQRSMISRLIQEAVDAGLIAPANPENTSKRHTEYVPAWAAPSVKTKG